MQSQRIWITLFSLFLFAAIAVGVVLALKPAPSRQQPEAVADEGKKDFGTLFSGLNPQKEGVAVVKVYGTIETESAEGFFGMTPGGADLIVKKIERIRKNKQVKAIVLRVNSPGGSVGASQEILAAIKRARKDGKKVVVSMADMAASGGYYVACHADKIYADPGTITGSIGVFVGGINITQLAKKIGVDMNVIKSGKFKDILSPWRDMTEEERQILQDTVNDVYGQFLAEVSTGRKIPLEELRTIADGRIFSGQQAKTLRLIDEIGGMQEAVVAAWNLAGLKGEPRIIKDYENWWEDMSDMFSVRAGEKTGLSGILAGSDRTTDYLPVTFLYSMGH